MNEAGFRHEIKYEISEASAARLASMLRGVMHPDRHAGENGYDIRSLYFDDLDYSAYRDKTDGVRERSKLRLRYYNGDDSYIVFENKEKLGDLTRKTAMRVTRDTAEAMLEGRPVTGDSGPLIDLYRALKASSLLQPRVLVDYHRLPYVFTASDVRVTIDSNVRTAPFRTGLLRQDLMMVPVLDPGISVLEVKYNEFLPPYLAEVLRTVPMRRIAVSKYVKCLGVLE